MGSAHALVVTGGHPYDRPAFTAMLDELRGVTYELAEHPETAARLRRGHVGADVIVFYDLPGLEIKPGTMPRVLPIADDVVASWQDLLADGQPLVFLHHAIAGWPVWPEYAEIIGGRFQYRGGSLRGQRWPDSGCQLDVPQSLTVINPDHPICRGVNATFPIVDESYVCPIFEDSITPLVTTDASRDAAAHDSVIARVLQQPEISESWTHPQGSPAVVWTKRAGCSPVAYLQPGHGPATYRDRNYRQLLANSIAWAASGSR